MSIESRFKDTIYVQAGTVAYGGAVTWADETGYNKGYIRVLSARERVSIDKPTLFATHRAVMTRTIEPVYGQRLRIGANYYMVKGVDQHELSGTFFQTVDCEVVH